MKVDVVYILINMKIYFNFNNKNIFFYKNNIKNLFFILKLFLTLVNNVKKNYNYMLNLFKLDTLFSPLYDMYINFDKLFKTKFLLFVLNENLLKDANFSAENSFLNLLTDKFDSSTLELELLLNVKKRFYFFKNLTKFNVYWNSIILRKGGIILIQKYVPQNSNQFIKNIWPIFEITDEVTRFRLNIDDGIGNSWLLHINYQTLKKTKRTNLNSVLLDSLNNIDETKELEKEFLDIEENKNERVIKYYKIKERSALKIKKRHDKIIELQESIYNRVVLKKIHTFVNSYNCIKKFKFFHFFYKLIKIRKLNKKRRFRTIMWLLYRTFKYKVYFLFKDYLNSLIFDKSKHIKKFFYLPLTSLNQLKETIFENNIIKVTLNKVFEYYTEFDLNSILFTKNLYLTEDPLKMNKPILIDYKKILDLKMHFLNMYYLGKSGYVSKKQIFFFTSNNIIFNMNFFYQYQFERWILQLIFFKINASKWLRVYFLKTLNMGQKVSLFFNLNNFFLTNIIKPTVYSYKVYKLLLFHSKRNKSKNIIRYFSKIMLTYFFKLFCSSYCLVFSKFNLSLLNKNIQNFLNLLNQSVRFELIRANFVFEFLNVCCLTFFSKDPKFLIKWIVKVLHKINFKKHWKFLYLFKYNVLKILDKFLQKSTLLGFHMTIRGKVGATGSVRKKTIHIQRGLYGFSRYYIGGDLYYLTAKTQTGIIGLKIIITYK